MPDVYYKGEQSAHNQKSQIFIFSKFWCYTLIFFFRWFRTLNKCNFLDLLELSLNFWIFMYNFWKQIFCEAILTVAGQFIPSFKLKNIMGKSLPNCIHRAYKCWISSRFQINCRISLPPLLTEYRPRLYIQIFAFSLVYINFFLISKKNVKCI